jgi:hypothetical protein
MTDGPNHPSGRGARRSEYARLTEHRAGRYSRCDDSCSAFVTAWRCYEIVVSLRGRRCQTVDDTKKQPLNKE